MSLATLEKKFDSFFSAAAHFLKEVFDDETTESKVLATLNLLTPAAQALVQLAGGPGAGALATASLAQFKADYSTLCSLVQGSFPAPNSNASTVVQGIIKSLSLNVAVILQDVGIKNSASFSKIQTYANFFLNEAYAILGEVSSPVFAAPGIQSAPVAAPATSAAIPGPMIVASASSSTEEEKKIAEPKHATVLPASTSAASSTKLI